MAFLSPDTCRIVSPSLGFSSCIYKDMIMITSLRCLGNRSEGTLSLFQITRCVYMEGVAWNKSYLVDRLPEKVPIKLKHEPCVKFQEHRGVKFSSKSLVIYRSEISQT